MKFLIPNKLMRKLDEKEIIFLKKFMLFCIFCIKVGQLICRMEMNYYNFLASSLLFCLAI